MPGESSLEHRLREALAARELCEAREMEVIPVLHKHAKLLETKGLWRLVGDYSVRDSARTLQLSPTRRKCTYWQARCSRGREPKDPAAAGLDDKNPLSDRETETEQLFLKREASERRVESNGGMKGEQEC